MDYEVRVRQKFAMPQIFTADLAWSICQMPRMRFVIGCVNNRGICGLKSVTKRQRRMIQVAGADCDVFDPKGSFDKLVVPDLSAEFVQLNRKVGILHLTF